MRVMRGLMRRFVADERGVFAVLFGVLAIVLVAAAGAVVDFVNVEQARTRAQIALDAAALALQPSITTLSQETLRSRAEALLIERLDDDRVSAEVLSATVDTDEGKLLLEARLGIPMNFVSLVGFETMYARIVTEATRKQLNLEVVFVLDNSNSMSNESRMTNLISATRCAVNILLNSNCNSTATTTANTNVWIGMVPFTMLVNVGTQYANASWIDRTGSAYTGGVRNIATDNFDSNDYDGDTFSGPVDRIALFSLLNNTSWGGCVEARITPYDTNDALPVAGTQTMFTPMFAPDEPSGFNNSYISDTGGVCTNIPPTWTWVQVKTNCNKNGNNSSSNYNSATCTGSTTNTYTQKNQLGQTVTPAATTQPSSLFNNSGDCTTEYDGTRTSTNPSRYRNTRTISCVYDFSDRELQERLCKYTGATPSGVSQAQAKGPNSDCPTNAITPLTATKSTITAAINQLAAQGGTNIHAGTEWGYRVLSPTEPFAQGRPYDQATSKVMIIMTDGENTAYQNNNMNNSSYYSHYGYPYNGRMGTSSSTDAQLEAEMNARTVATCNNAKADGIIIYTIGLATSQTSNPTANTTMLQNCSSGVGYYYFPTQSSALTTVFTDIANQLSALRIAQ